MTAWWQQHRTLCERALQQKGVSEYTVPELICLAGMQLEKAIRELDEEHEETRKSRLQKWRERMQQGVAEVSQWLKSRDAVAVPQIHDGKGKVA